VAWTAAQGLSWPADPAVFSVVCHEVAEQIPHRSQKQPTTAGNRGLGAAFRHIVADTVPTRHKFALSASYPLCR
jgi:hypothetical protein